jgi:hypothetical protein
MIALLFLALIQDAPIVTGQKAVLDQMTADMSAEIEHCGTRAVFIIPKGRIETAEAKAVIDAAATPDQIKCAKGVVSWLVSDAEARAKGWK